MTADLLRAPGVTAATGCTYRQLDHWASAGYITPAAVEASGKAGRRTRRPVARPGSPGAGRARLWAPDEVETVRRVVPLVALGLNLDTAFKIARSTTPTDLGHGIVLTAPWSTP